MTTSRPTKKINGKTLTPSQVVASALDAELAPLGKVIAISNQKGGVGKTSSSYNFAHYLSEMGYKVAVVDCDGQGNLTELFFDQDVLANYVYTRALELFQWPTETEEQQKENLSSFRPLHHESGIDVVATPRNDHQLHDIDTKSIELIETFYMNVRLIAQLYDFVIIDTPPAPGLRTSAACATADYIFAPVEIDIFGESALEGVFKSITNIGELLEIELKLDGVLVNAWQDTGAEARQDYEVLAAKVGHPLIPTPIRRSKAFVKAQRLRVPVWHVRSSGSEQRTARETRKAYGEMALRIKEIAPERVAYFNDLSRAVRARHATDDQD